MTVIAAQERQFADITVNEANIVRISGTLLDELSAAVPVSSLISLTLTLYDKATETILNGRNEEDILNVNGGTVHPSSGAFTLTLSSEDNVIVSETLQAFQTELHIALIQATWTAGGYWSGIALVKVRQVHRTP